MKKLELKHLAPYLPYGLKVKFIDATRFGDISMLEPRDLNNNYTSDIKPILRPLSDLTKEIDWGNNGNKILFERLFHREHFLRLQKELRITNNRPILEFLDYGIVEKMFENHFDVFGLIEKGLAIDINTLEK